MATIGSYFTKKVVLGLGVIATLLTIVGGIWGFEAHYATKTEVNKVEVVAKEKVSHLEIQIASALQNQQYKSDVRYFTIMLDKIQRELEYVRKQIREFPDDGALRQDYTDLLQQRNEVKQKIENAMRNIRVN